MVCPGNTTDTRQEKRFLETADISVRPLEIYPKIRELVIILENYRFLCVGSNLVGCLALVEFGFTVFSSIPIWNAAT